MEKKKNQKKKKKKKTKRPNVPSWTVGLGLTVFLVGITAGIWVDAFRGRLIATGIWALFLALILSFLDTKMKEDYDKKNIKTPKET